MQLTNTSGQASFIKSPFHMKVYITIGGMILNEKQCLRLQETDQSSCTKNATPNLKQKKYSLNEQSCHGANIVK